jgi:hypothetical protein
LLEVFPLAPFVSVGVGGRAISAKVCPSFPVARFSLLMRQKSGKERDMKKHIVSGILIGGMFGALTAWLAMAEALPEGGLVALAGAFDGVMAGLGIGWLIGVNVAEGTIDAAGEEAAYLPPSGALAEARS